MDRIACYILALILLPCPMGFSSTSLAAQVALPLPTAQTPQKKKDNKPKKKNQKPTKGTKKQKGTSPQKQKKPAPQTKKQKRAPAKAKTIQKTINRVAVAFPGEPTVRTYDESVTYTLMTTHSALTVMHLKKIKTDGELVYFSPEYKNSESWKQEVMAYQEIQKVGQAHLKLPNHWKATDYKAPLGKRYAATYKVSAPKPRQGRIISFLEENGIVVVQVVTMKPGAAGEKERTAFIQSVKLAAQ